MTDDLHSAIASQKHSRASSRQTLTSIAAVLAGGALLVFVLAGFVSGVVSGQNFSGYSADGPFQLYNPLRRIAAGEVLGVDFPFFHGIGVVAAHYPVFELFGANIFASEVARFTVSPLFFVGSTLIFMRAALGDWRRALIAAAVAACLVATMGKMIDPSNSLLGIRSTAPVLAAAALLWRPRHRMTARRWTIGSTRFGVPDVLAPAILGVGVLFGTEQAIGTIAALVLLRLSVGLISQRRAEAIVRVVLDLAVIAASTLLTATVLTAGNPLAPLRYAFLSIPSDQGWVFGAPPNAVMTVPGLISEFTWLTPPLWASLVRDGSPVAAASIYTIWLIGAVALSATAVRRQIVRPRQGAVFGMLLTGTLVTAAGSILSGYIFLADQLAPMARASALIGIAAATALLLPRSRRHRAPQRPAIARVLVALSAAAALIVCSYSSYLVIDRQVGTGARGALHGIPSAIGSTDRELAGPSWTDAIDRVDDLVGADAEVWATYAGIVQSSRSQIVAVPGGEDYQIHAVGNDRRVAYDDSLAVQRPDATLTMIPDQFPYEEWLWSKWPEYYISLFTQYSFAGEAGPYFVWSSTDRRSTPSQPASVVETASGYRLSSEGNTAGGVTLYLVDVDYEARGIIDPATRFSRYLLDTEGSRLGFSISLPPTSNSWRFLVPASTGSPVDLTTRVTGAFGGQLDIVSISAVTLDFPAENAEIFNRMYCETHVDGYCPS